MKADEKKQDLFTIKEYAEKVGITQQAVYKRIKSSLFEYVVEVDGQKYIKAEALSERDNSAEASSGTDAREPADTEPPETVQKAYSETMEILQKQIDILQGQLTVKDEQLTAKDEQIKALNDRLKELNGNLQLALNNTAQSHYLTAQAQANTIGSSESTTEPAEANEATDTIEPAEQKQSFWKRIFHAR